MSNETELNDKSRAEGQSLLNDGLGNERIKMKVTIDGVGYVPESEIRNAEKGVRYIMACEVTAAQREQASKSTLYNYGDMRLVWVNEGDMYACGEFSA